MVKQLAKDGPQLGKGDSTLLDKINQKFNTQMDPIAVKITNQEKNLNLAFR